MQTDQPCFCGSKYSFEKCCDLFISYRQKPKTAEQLMRSRYSAFVTKNDAYLLHTWQQSQRPQTIDFEPNIKWLGLKVKNTKSGLALDNEGWVEFVARYKVSGKAERIEELSYFVKEDEQWLYVRAENLPLDSLK